MAIRSEKNNLKTRIFQTGASQTLLWEGVGYIEEVFKKVHQGRSRLESKFCSVELVLRGVDGDRNLVLSHHALFVVVADHKGHQIRAHRHRLFKVVSQLERID